MQVMFISLLPRTRLYPQSRRGGAMTLHEEGHSLERGGTMAMS